MTTTHTAADLKALLKIAADHLAQYRAYSAEMQKIGRGVHISSAYQPETLAVMLDSAVADATTISADEFNNPTPAHFTKVL